MAEAPAPLTQCPPWLLGHWQDIYKRHEQGRLPHALLFTGIQGLGKKQFVRFVVESLLCRDCSPTKGACGVCESCSQLTAGAHPEFSALHPEGKSLEVKVDAVRELVNWLQISAPPNQYRAALIDHADAMNRNAANSLLKTLEEPGERAVLILCADKPGTLPATIRSRCQATVLTLQDKDAAAAWLAENNVADAAEKLSYARVGPYALLEQSTEAWLEAEKRLQSAWLNLFLMRASIGKIVDSVSDLPVKRCLGNFSYWAMLASKHHQNLPVGADHATSELIAEVQSQLDSEQWFALYDRIQYLYRSDSASFKAQAVLEGLFAATRTMTKG